ncbi:MAG TPA: DUF882 domain-containing protein [Nitrospirota bacterium]|nr:DUF882 domain-containing protein [Nitrospirota bacterium]
MITRRNFLKMLTLVTLSAHSGKVFGLDSKERVLNLYNIHTGERLNVKYYSSGSYDRDAMNEINYLMRCHYTNEVKPIDVKVIDLLCDIKDTIGKDKDVLIISGYRSHEYNEHLRQMGRGVACNSLHLQGRAIDFRLHRVDNRKLAAFAKTFHSGGVGTYPDFVHIDDGRVRYW